MGTHITKRLQEQTINNNIYPLIIIFPSIKNLLANHYSEISLIYLKGLSYFFQMTLTIRFFQYLD